MNRYRLIIFGLITFIHSVNAQTIDIKFFDACDQKVKSLPFTLDSFDTLIHIAPNSEVKVDSGFYFLETNLQRGDYYHSFFFYLVLSKNYYSDTLYLNKISSGWEGTLHPLPPRKTVYHFDCTTLCEGELTEIDSNGNVRTKGKFQKGQPSGRLDYFDAKGNLMRREIHRNGNLKKIKKTRTITNSN